MKPSRKGTVLRALTDYFLEKGEIMDSHTYVKQDDIPVPPRTIKRLIGNWSRIKRMIKVNFPEDFNKITGVEVQVEEAELTEEVDSEKEAKEAKVAAAKAKAAEVLAKLGEKDEE